MSTWEFLAKRLGNSRKEEWSKWSKCDLFLVRVFACMQLFSQELCT